MIEIQPHKYLYIYLHIIAGRLLETQWVHASAVSRCRLTLVSIPDDSERTTSRNWKSGAGRLQWLLFKGLLYPLNQWLTCTWRSLEDVFFAQKSVIAVPALRFFTVSMGPGPYPTTLPCGLEGHRQLWIKCGCSSWRLSIIVQSVRFVGPVPREIHRNSTQLQPSCTALLARTNVCTRRALAVASVKKEHAVSSLRYTNLYQIITSFTDIYRLLYCLSIYDPIPL